MQNENTSLEQNTILEIKNLSRTFGEQIALNNISLNVKKGQVFGIVGENGAGKTTLIKHLLGQYIAQQGSVILFDLDPVEEPEKVLAKIGYLSEEPELPAWMTVKELLNYTAAFYPNWDHQYASELTDVFSLQLNKKISELSKGQKARVALVLAQAHRPELLLLDEPSSGLDPNVRRDILSAIIKTVADDGKTVIFSSHLLEEVERVSDHLMMLDSGKILLSDSMENVLATHHRFVIKENDVSNIKNLREYFFPFGLFNCIKNSNEFVLDFEGVKNAIEKSISDNSLEITSHRNMSLNDIFVSRSDAYKGV
ncbi:MAG: ABC-2 type transport system ATP-binding protein [Polaribacter sp.]|jgi:ABC-2 type transport system ATP-binding protein